MRKKLVEELIGIEQIQRQVIRMRLIDADELIKVLDKEPQYTLKIQKGLKQVPEAIKYHHNKIIEIIKKQPTAFDAEKLIQNIEKETGYLIDGFEEPHRAILTGVAVRLIKEAVKQKHNIKILKCYADEVVKGTKTFEVRKNDRNYKEGDIIQFDCIDSEGNKIAHDINSISYKIAYVLSGWGIQDGWVAFGIKEMK